MSDEAPIGRVRAETPIGRVRAEAIRRVSVCERRAEAPIREQLVLVLASLSLCGLV